MELSSTILCEPLHKSLVPQPFSSHNLHPESETKPAYSDLPEQEHSKALQVSTIATYPKTPQLVEEYQMYQFLSQLRNQPSPN